MNDTTKATIMRIIMALCIALSITFMYFVYIVQKDYEIVTNPNGLPTLPE